MIRGRDIQCFGDWTGLWPLAFGIGTLAFIGPVGPIGPIRPI
jgi:hypothetical protein